MTKIGSRIRVGFSFEGSTVLRYRLKPGEKKGDMDYPITSVPFTHVQIKDSFWLPRLHTNRDVTIPYAFKKCEETGRVSNFAKAAGTRPGKFEGIAYNDSDVFKVIEGAAYSLSTFPNPDLETYLADLIDQIAAAQEDDGYLYTLRTINQEDMPERAGPTRWSYLRHSHELYNAGHLYEAAVAYYQTTGKPSLLNIAIKNADLIDNVFGLDRKRDVPGHQEIEIGLVKLYRVTGQEKYLNLAKFFLDERGYPHDRELYGAYSQDHAPIPKQAEAVGHAVRAAYMYSAVADVAALTGDTGYVKAIDQIWENVVSRKLYLTGGIGAQHMGEAFSDNYELPNATAYAETCAAVANIMWNHRMFLLHGDAKYMDILERTLYNGFLSGVSLDGSTFFYANPLESDGSHPFNRDGSATRSPWFSTSCCPPNVGRLLPALPGYIYAHQGDALYVNLFIAGTSAIELRGGPVELTQETDYPWCGIVRLTVMPGRAAEFKLKLRIPGWAQSRPVPSNLYHYLNPGAERPLLTVNKEPVFFEVVKGFASIERVWEQGDVVELHLPTPVRRVLSYGQVSSNAGRVAIERGPIVYCAEGADHDGSVLDRALTDDSTLEAEHLEHELGNITIIRCNPQTTSQNASSKRKSIRTLIPYYAWSHRGAGEMSVWLRRDEQSASVDT